MATPGVPSGKAIVKEVCSLSQVSCDKRDFPDVEYHSVIFVIEDAIGTTCIRLDIRDLDLLG